MSKIGKFCKNPTPDNFRTLLTTKEQNVFFETSKICIEDDVGNQELARKVINFYKGMKLIPKVSKGLKALLRGIRLLQSTNNPLLFLKAKDKEGNTFFVKYGSEFPSLYFIIQKHSKSVDKELNLDFENVVDFFIDFAYTYSYKIRNIYVGNKKLYSIKSGIVWE